MELKSYIAIISELTPTPFQTVYLKSEADKVIAHHKYRRCLLYAKNHKNLGDLAADAARLIGLNAYAFTKETETACIAYWNRIRDCHYRHYNEWLELAEKFKEGA